MFSDPRVIAALGAAVLLALLLLGLIGLRAARRRPPNWIVLDGSNILYWKDDSPQIASVRAVVRHLTAMNYAPVVWFDATAGHKIAGRYLGPEKLARLIDLPATRVRVVDRGNPADPEIIAEAERLGTYIVTNDRFRDWQANDASLRLSGFLIGGSITGRKVRLNLPGGDQPPKDKPAAAPRKGLSKGLTKGRASGDRYRNRR